MRILILNQAFYPDVVATAHYSAHLAAELAAQGHQVTAMAASRAYDNPMQRFASRETWQKVKIERIYTPGLGKTAKWRRLVDFVVFFCICAWRLALMARQDVVVALTSPPLIGFLAALFVRLKGGALLYWVMDLNPDQAIAAGILQARDMRSKALEAMLRFTLSTSSRIVVLDRFMRERICRRGVDPALVSVIPPWPHDEALRFDHVRREAFRNEHDLEDKFVVMYAGNHSPCHPLDTVLRAADELAAEKEIVFCFVGGGSEHRKIASHVAHSRRSNILCLPYPPVEQLADPLFAADLHVVVMGDPYVGIVHPCKVYNILSLGTPLLYIGPAESHVTDLAGQNAMHSLFYSAPHNSVGEVTAAIRAAKHRGRRERLTKQMDAAFSQRTLLMKLSDAIQSFESVEGMGVAEPLSAVDVK
jgi:glycosyltransferase involved in cell wall biosynthesis